MSVTTADKKLGSEDFVPEVTSTVSFDVDRLVGSVALETAETTSLLTDSDVESVYSYSPPDDFGPLIVRQTVIPNEVSVQAEETEPSSSLFQILESPDIVFVRDGQQIRQLAYASVERANALMKRGLGRKPEDGYPYFVEATEEELVNGRDYSSLAFIDHLADGAVLVSPYFADDHIQKHDIAEHGVAVITMDNITFSDFIEAAKVVNKVSDPVLKKKLADWVAGTFDQLTEFALDYIIAKDQGNMQKSTERILNNAIKKQFLKLYLLLNDSRMRPASKASKNAMKRYLESINDLRDASSLR